MGSQSEKSRMTPLHPAAQQHIQNTSADKDKAENHTWLSLQEKDEEEVWDKDEEEQRSCDIKSWKEEK